MFCVLPAEGIAQSLDDRLQKERDRLLVAYATFKSYSSTDPQDVYSGLKPDRQAIFDAVIRAVFVELEDGSGRATAGPSTSPSTNALSRCQAAACLYREQQARSCQEYAGIISLARAGAKCPDGTAPHFVLESAKMSRGCA